MPEVEVTTTVYVDIDEALERLTDAEWHALVASEDKRRKLLAGADSESDLDKAVDSAANNSGRCDADALLHLSRAIPALARMCDRLTGRLLDGVEHNAMPEGMR